MKVIIAGSRTISDMSLVEDAIEESGFEITEVVCGMAKGVDTLGEEWACANGRVNISRFPAFWKKLDDLPPEKVSIKHGKYGPYNALAGHNRNQEMADYADALIAVTSGSSGTADMIRRAEKSGLKIYIKKI